MDTDTLSQMVGFLANPALFYAGIGAAIGAAFYAVWDFIQGTASRPWREQNKTKGRGHGY